MIDSAATMSGSATNVIAKPRQTLRRINASISAGEFVRHGSALSRSGRDGACAPQCDQRRLLLARVADFHRLGFLAAAVLVPFEDVMVFVGDLYGFADL